MLPVYSLSSVLSILYPLIPFLNTVLIPIQVYSFPIFDLTEAQTIVEHALHRTDHITKKANIALQRVEGEGEGEGEGDEGDEGGVLSQQDCAILAYRSTFLLYLSKIACLQRILKARVCVGQDGQGGKGGSTGVVGANGKDEGYGENKGEKGEKGENEKGIVDSALCAIRSEYALVRLTYRATPLIHYTH